MLRYTGNLLVGTPKAGTGNGHDRPGLVVESRAGPQPGCRRWRNRQRSALETLQIRPRERRKPSGRHHDEGSIRQVERRQQQLVEDSQIPGQRVACLRSQRLWYVTEG